MKKYRINKLKATRTLLALLTAGAIGISLSSCNGEINMISLSPSAVLENENVQSITLMDDLIWENKLVYEGELDIVEAADQLERYLDIIDLLKDMDFSRVPGLEPLRDEQYQEVFSLPMRELKQLKKDASYKGNDVDRSEQRLYALKQLDYLYRHCTEWVHANGQDISFSFMLAAVKTAVADELGITTRDYSKIVIPPTRRSASAGPEPYVVKVGDTLYQVPVGAGEIWNTINYIYEVQGAHLTDKTEYATYRKSLNYGKVTMAAGVEEHNGKLRAENNITYIKKNILP